MFSRAQLHTHVPSNLDNHVLNFSLSHFAFSIIQPDSNYVAASLYSITGSAQLLRTEQASD